MAFDCVTTVRRWESVPVLVCSSQAPVKVHTPNIQRQAKLVSPAPSANYTDKLRSCNQGNSLTECVPRTPVSPAAKRSAAQRGGSDRRTRPMRLQRALFQLMRDELSPRYRPSGELLNASRPSTRWARRPDCVGGILLRNHCHDERCVCVMQNKVRTQSASLPVASILTGSGGYLQIPVLVFRRTWHSLQPSHIAIDGCEESRRIWYRSSGSCGAPTAGLWPS